MIMPWAFGAATILYFRVEGGTEIIARTRRALTEDDMVKPTRLVLGFVMAAAVLISSAMNVTEASAQNRCVAKCTAYCNKHWPSGGDNSECKHRCVTRHHC